ncbi:MAG: AIPR family protein, partial [Burkholderiales bacterium]|nr:AIPR family protein [Burkholderiales bacterium]
MSIHVRQLEQYFLNAVAASIDITDLNGRPPGEIQQATLSRSLTAFAISGLTSTPIKQAATHVFDGSRDQGVDGCYFDPSKNKLIFVQSKWNASGTKTIGKGDLLKFIHGVKLVLSANWDTFSTKFKSQKAAIEQVLLKPDVSVIVAVAFTGDNKLGDECDEVLKQFQAEQNSSGDFLETRILDLRTLHRYFRTVTLAAQPNFTAMLLDWGQVTDPHQAVYGRICCEELAKLYTDVGEVLFEPNIRSFLGDGEVNNQIIGTLLNKPEDFWYLNNGVTGICTKYSKTALGGGDNRQAGTFVFQGLQIV